MAACLLLSACTVTRVAPPQPQAAPVRFKEVVKKDAAPEVILAMPDSWWVLYKDPVLDDLERRVVLGNENLKSSVAQLAIARAALDASNSAKLPTLSAGLTAIRSGNAQAAAATPNPSNSVALNANASWELDVWGRLAAASQGTNANVQASQADLAAARLSVQALLAQTYFSMRAAEAQQTALDKSVLAYQRSLDLTQIRLEAGVAALSDALQARTQLNTAQAQLAEAAASRAQLEHAIAVLLGLAPSSFALDRTSKLPQAVEVPVSLPSTLLQRRPDIAAAQQRVAAAYAQIGMADAAMFPVLSLNAGAGYSQNSIANLLSMPNPLWSLGASLAQSIFDGGQHKQASTQARAAADQATSAYRQLVLTALQEVEDNLALTGQLSNEMGYQEHALQAAQKNLEIVQEQYRAGTVSYLNVVIAQTASLSSEINLLSVKNRYLAATNQLLKNIAGRWDVSE